MFIYDYLPDSHYIDQNEEFLQRIKELEETNAQLNNQLAELQSGDSNNADNTKTEQLKKELGLYKKTEKDLKKKATADAALIFKHEDTIAAMILQSDAGSGNNKTSKKRGVNKKRKVANENESDDDTSTSEADAIVVAQKKTKNVSKSGKASASMPTMNYNDDMSSSLGVVQQTEVSSYYWSTFNKSFILFYFTILFFRVVSVLQLNAAVLLR